MKIDIDDPQIDEMVSCLSRITGETPEVVIRHSVKERLERLSADDQEAYMSRVRAITRKFAALPTLDTRTPNEIVGYNEHGLFD